MQGTKNPKFLFYRFLKKVNFLVHFYDIQIFLIQHLIIIMNKSNNYLRLLAIKTTIDKKINNEPSYKKILHAKKILYIPYFFYFIPDFPPKAKKTVVFHSNHSPNHRVSPIPLIQGSFPINDITSFQSSPKNNPRKSSKFASLKVISTPLKKSMARFFTFCFCCLKSFRKPPVNMEIIKPKEYALPILSFFKLLIMIIRIKETFRNRTKFRSLRGIKDLHGYLIDDLAIFRKKWNDIHTNLRYASCGFLRRVMRGIRKRFRKFRKAVKKFKGKGFS